MDRAYSRCQEILEKDRDKLETVAQYLLQHETMDAPAFYAVYGESGARERNAPGQGREEARRGKVRRGES